MTEPTRTTILHVPEIDILDWDTAGWAYVGPSEQADYCIIEWRQSRPPVAPLKDCQSHVAAAVAALEGRTP